MKNLISPIPFNKTEITGGFWKSRIELNSSVTLMAVYERFKESGRFGALKCTPRGDDSTLPMPHYFWDSDVAKWIEGASYILINSQNAELEALCDGMISDIIENQTPEGYFNSYYLSVDPAARFKDRDKHELYCAGHLIEAAIAYKTATGKGEFLNAMCRYADYIEKRFKTDRDTAFTVPGHEEIEIALIRLYEATGEMKYLSLAEYFINERGNATPPLSPTASNEYDQSHLPVRRQRHAAGHAVRATYLYTAMARLYKHTGDKALLEACESIFDDIVKKKMYITGGIGSSASGEAFTVDYDLPNILSYSESCAAMGFIFFASEMLSVTGDSKYADAIERTLYNGFLSSTSLDGKAFFYTNPLEVMPYLSEKDRATSYYKIKYPAPKRSEIFKTSCCPSNIVRVVPKLAELAVCDDGERVYIHQYMSLKTSVQRGEKNISLTVETDFPRSGKVEISASGGAIDIAVRIPSWDKTNKQKTQHGYAHFHINDGEICTLEFDMSPRIVEAREEVLFAAAKCAVMRGPVVYCSEGVDNGSGLRNIILDPSSQVEEISAPEYVSPLLIVGGVRRISQKNELYSAERSSYLPIKIKLIPYHAFANRGTSEMAVWHYMKI